MRLSTALITVVLAIPTTAWANQLPPIKETKTVASGTPFKVAVPSSVNPDCSSRGEPSVRLERSPAHGKLRLTRGMNFGTFSGLYASCNTVRVKGLELWYTSDRGYTGPDALSFEVIYPTGNVRVESYEINVR